MNRDHGRSGGRWRGDDGGIVATARIVEEIPLMMTSMARLCSVLALGWAVWSAGCSHSSPAPGEQTNSDAPGHKGATYRESADASATRRGELPTDGRVPDGSSAAVAIHPALPKVLLTEAHAATSLVKDGDTMPGITLPDLEGQEQSLASLQGEALTVVLFWSGHQALSRLELDDLTHDVAVPFSDRGVRVVGIAVGEKADTAAKYAKEAHVTYPVLVDADRQAFGLVATESLPRTYLLDAQGTILWFDLEYSRSTRRELLESIRFVLGP